MARHTFPSILRFHVAIWLLLRATSGMAQEKAPELDYLIRFSGPVSTYQEKRVHEVLQAHEPGLGVWLDVPNQQVKVRTHLALDRQTLQGYWVDDGLVINHFRLISPPVRQEQLGVDAEDRFPQYIDTGDPAADAAAYQAAKAAWIAAHPEVYQYMEQHPGDQ
jgi:hypothetical protein